MKTMDIDIDVKALRKRLGLTRDQFAKKLDVGPSFVGHLQSGRRRPSRALLAKLFKLSEEADDKTAIVQEALEEPRIGKGLAADRLPLDLDASKGRYAIGLPQRFPRLMPGAEREAQSVLDTLGIEAPSPMTPLRVSEGKCLWAVWCYYPVDVMKKLLDGHNAHNRVVKAASVARYAGRMRPGGGWLQAGDPIKLGMDCALYDGQTRLKAAVVVGDPPRGPHDPGRRRRDVPRHRPGRDQDRRAALPVSGKLVPRHAGQARAPVPPLRGQPERRLARARKACPTGTDSGGARTNTATRLAHSNRHRFVKRAGVGLVSTKTAHAPAACLTAS